MVVAAVENPVEVVRSLIRVLSLATIDSSSARTLIDSSNSASSTTGRLSNGVRSVREHDHTFAGDDRLINPEGSRAFGAMAPKEVVTTQRFESLYHEVLNELDAKPVFAALKHWLDQRF